MLRQSCKPLTGLSSFSPFKSQWSLYISQVLTLKKKFYVLPTQCIYVFCVDFRTNSDYFPIQHKLTGFYNREEVCLLRGTDWVSLYVILCSVHTAVFMCFVWISEQTAIISLYSINWLVFITETECVYCAVRTGSVNVIYFNLGVLMDCLKWSKCNVVYLCSSFCWLSVSTYLDFIRILRTFGTNFNYQYWGLYKCFIIFFAWGRNDCSAWLLTKAHFVLDSNYCS